MSGWWSAASAPGASRSTNATASANEAKRNVFTIASPSRRQPLSDASAPATASSLSRAMHALRDHLSGADLDREVVLVGGDRAVVVRREGARRVVREVEVDDEAAIRLLVRIEVPTDRIRLAPGGAIAEVQDVGRLADAGLEEAPRRDPHRRPGDLEIEPPHAESA